MARKDRDSSRRSERRTRNVETAEERRSDNYGEIVKNMSTNTDDSSQAVGSEVASENSHYTTSEDDSTSAGSSFETESYLSSILEEMDLGAETEELLGNDELMAALSYESRPSMVGGWFDFACGWMDRPNLCVAPGLGGAGGNQTSLLRQSKAAKAIQRVKLNDTFKKAADNASASQEKKSKSDVERIQRDVAKAAAAAAESVRKQEIQPTQLTAIEEEQDEEDRQPRKKEIIKVPKTLDDRRDEEIELKMKQVSARAAEILKNTIEARAKTPNEEANEEREESPPKKLSHSDRRKKVFEQLARDRTSPPSSDDERVVEGDTSQKYNDDADIVVQVATASHETKEKSTRSQRSTHSVVTREQPDDSVATGEIVHLEEVAVVEAAKTEQTEDDDIEESDNDMKQPSSPSPPPREQDPSQHSRSPDISANPSITDLTHIDDDEGQEDGNIVERIEHQEPAEPRLSRRKSPPKRSTRLAALHKNDLGRRDVEFVDVFELDDEDSWTPGETIDAIPSRSNHHSLSPNNYSSPNNSLDRRFGNRSPMKGNRASLFGAHVPSADSHNNEPRRSQKSSPRDAAFNDPRAREAFAGLRRGRIETNEKLYDKTSADLGNNHKADAIIEAEVAMRKSRSRESRQQLAETTAKPRRRIPEITTPNASNSAEEIWNTDSSSRRSKHLVAVRSIDEAQRLRNGRARELHEAATNQPRSRAMSRELIDYGHRASANYESPIDSRQYLKPRTYSDHEAVARSARDYHQQHESPRPERFLSVGRQSSTGRDHEGYNSLIITRSKSRERDRHSEYMEEQLGGANRYGNGNTGRSGLLRGRDMRDDSDTRYVAGSRSDPSGYIPHDNYGESKSRRRERTTNAIRAGRESEKMRDLRSLETKINKQLSAHEITGGWDEQSVVSVKQLRHLEKKLVQSIKDDEKRTDKLQRIRSKKPSSHTTVSGGRGLEGEGSTMMPDDVMMMSPDKSGVDLQDARFKYNHLKVLRQSRQMHKYMQRTGSRTDRLGAAPRPEAY